MSKMLLIKEHLKGVNATIDTAMSNMEKVTQTLETGGAQQYLFKDDQLKELDEIIRKLDQKGSQGRLQHNFTLNREYIGWQNPILQKWTPPTLPTPPLLPPLMLTPSTAAKGSLRSKPYSPTSFTTRTTSGSQPSLTSWSSSLHQKSGKRPASSPASQRNKCSLSCYIQ